MKHFRIPAAEKSTRESDLNCCYFSRTPTDFLEETAAEPLLMEEVARCFHLSLPTLNRKFQQTFGMTPYHYRLEQRMKRAEELLMQTTLPVKEIAFRL